VSGGGGGGGGGGSCGFIRHESVERRVSSAKWLLLLTKPDERLGFISHTGARQSEAAPPAGE